MKSHLQRLFLCLVAISVFGITASAPPTWAKGRSYEMCQDEKVQPLPPPGPVKHHGVLSAISAIAHKVKMTLGEINTYLAAEDALKDGPSYESWKHILGRLLNKVVTPSLFPPREAGQPSLLGDEGYRREMGALFAPNVEFTAGNKVELLVNGCAAFAKREELIENAQQSIHIFVWAIYDDETGREFSDWLSAAKNRRIAEGGDLDIKIIVDGNLAKELGTRTVLSDIENLTFSNGSRIQVVKLHDTRDPFFGMHRKLMIVDGRQVVMGGMNVGNIYSHLGPDPSGLWRDTDAYVTGPVVNQAEAAFVSEWNEQEHSGEKMTYAPAQFAENPGSSLSMIIDHQPLRDDNTHQGIMKAFYGATRSIDIENAYVILDLVNERALTDALKRGVKVRILSNSKESIDEPVMTVPILQSLARLQAQGAQVFLKKNYPQSQTLLSKGPESTTLHSKFLIVDGVFTMIGSYNFHPRSYRYEREVVLASFDENLASQMEAVFESDIIPERAVDPSASSLKAVKASLLNKIIKMGFFDQL